MNQDVRVSYSRHNKPKLGVARWRELAVLSVLFLVAAGLLFKAVILQVVEKDYLQSQGDARYQVVKKQPSLRGLIVDRNDTPLAISSPVDSIWGYPPALLEQSEKYSYKQLVEMLGMDRAQFMKLLKRYEKNI